MDEETPAELVNVRALLRGLPAFPTDLPEFDPETAFEDPVPQFVQWLSAAIDAEVPEPHAVTVSTADADGHPSARTLLFKDVDSAGNWYFASHATSRKGRELAANPHAALTFYWRQQGRQIRVVGPVTPADAQLSAADFLARSPAARAESLTGRQSQIVHDPADVDEALALASALVATEADAIAPDWTLYAVAAAEVEFWQADKHRRHTRLHYRRTGDGWTRNRLWP